ncbi:YggS family pyridoxal phosphate-dependent enzyme [Thalassobaculum sp. OXR-137]|uniref:YggS family pyridoxal phosphate-dependent enzyme n=1 Tax=Thalassobaculum sp. OXR-137 TaxID=3100173 RepID=UPI002AC9AE21|nr:YggS family pyridoxal phosphate-dependent enzyme [Thalassobaculum sp. OXR-137]WPZ35469.1 YggS family pyridoxal phosphate-dependent enzyme [Thalassobaculum sp. OXR-137]
MSAATGQAVGEDGGPVAVDPHLVRQISDNIDTIRHAIEKAAGEAERDPAAVTLIAVGKVQPVERVEAALLAGQRVFGENRVQEAKSKWPDFRSRYEGVELHLIGPLQTNKVKEAVELFDVIQTVDRPKLARELAKEMEKQGRKLACYIQVNTGEEEQKAGVSPAEADAFIAECRDMLGLTVVGLMCIPPVEDNPALHFAMLREVAKRNGLANLSMGMSGDFETAVEMGATHVRVGTAIFGARDYD